jgi:hypothetical protein
VHGTKPGVDRAGWPSPEAPSATWNDPALRRSLATLRQLLNEADEVELLEADPGPALDRLRKRLATAEESAAELEEVA